VAEANRKRRYPSPERGGGTGAPGSGQRPARGRAPRGGWGDGRKLPFRAYPRHLFPPQRPPVFWCDPRPMKGRAHEASCMRGAGSGVPVAASQAGAGRPVSWPPVSKPVPSAPWGVVNGCVGRRRAGLTRLSGHRSPQGTGLDLAGTCPCGGTPLVAARETSGAEQRRSRMVDGAATRRPPAHVPRCRGAGTQIAGRVLAERPLSDYTRLAFVERPPPLRLSQEARDCSEGTITRSGNRPREREATSCVHSPCHHRRPEAPGLDPGVEPVIHAPWLAMTAQKHCPRSRPGVQGKP
jgi:hypothetical protein